MHCVLRTSNISQLYKKVYYREWKTVNFTNFSESSIVVTITYQLEAVERFFTTLTILYKIQNTSDQLQYLHHTLLLWLQLWYNINLYEITLSATSAFFYKTSYLTSQHVTSYDISFFVSRLSQHGICNLFFCIQDTFLYIIQWTSAQRSTHWNLYSTCSTTDTLTPVVNMCNKGF